MKERARLKIIVPYATKKHPIMMHASGVRVLVMSRNDVTHTAKVYILDGRNRDYYATVSTFFLMEIH